MKIGLIFVFLFTFFSYGQNLVPNPSFELYSTCPSTDNSFPVLNWNRVLPIDNSYFTNPYRNSCSTIVGNMVPESFTGNQLAHDGNGYIRTTYAYYNNSDGLSNRTEHFYVRLLENLIPGNEYKFKIHLNVADNSKVSLPGFGAWFVTDSTQYIINNPTIEYKSNVMVYGAPQILFSTAVLDKDNWVLLEANFVAAASYKYMMIGFFNSNPANIIFHDYNNSNHIQNPTFYIDSVSVEEVVKNLSILVNEKLLIEIFPNPTSDILFLGRNDQVLYDVQIYDMNGRFLKKWSAVNKIDTSNFSEGIYLLHIKKDNFETFEKVVKK